MDEVVEGKMSRIVKAISEGRYRYTLHGAQQRIARGIKRFEIEEAVKNGEIIEDYPKHHYGPACLVYGKIESGKVLHILCSVKDIVDIITVYEPEVDEWEEDLKTRRRKV